MMSTAATTHSLRQKIFLSLLLVVLLLSFSLQQDQPSYVRKTLGFGSNERGQLGIIDTYRLNRLKFGSNSVGVNTFCASREHSVLYSNTSTLYTWGINTNQLGYLKEVQDYQDTPRAVPITVAPNNFALASLGCGYSHTLILDSANNKIYGFGANDQGQLGASPSITTQYVNPSDVTPPSLSGITFKKVFAIGSSSFIVSSTDTLYTYGSNAAGQLGFENPSFSQTYTEVPHQLLNNVKTVVGGQDFTLYLTNNGELYGSGSNVQGQLGLNSSTIFFQFNVTKIPFFQGVEVKLVAAAAQAALVYTANNELYAFGRNENGQLGLPEDAGTPDSFGLTVLAPTKVDLSAITNLAQVQLKSIHLASDHAVLLTTDNHIYACGKNEYGQLGVLNATITAVKRFIATDAIAELPASDNVVSEVYTETEATFVVTSSSSLYSVGKIVKTGHGAFLAKATPISSAIQFDKTYGGYYFSLGVEETSGNLYAWGRDDFKLISTADDRDRYLPTKIPTLGDKNNTFIGVGSGNKLSASFYTIYSILNDTSKVYGWGKNGDGQLALGDIEPAQISEPLLMSGISNDTVPLKIEAGARHAIMVGRKPGTSSLDVYAWGSNNEGQLGLRQLPQLLTRLKIREAVIDACAGDFSTLIVEGTDTLVVAGDNTNGQLGMGAIGALSAFTENPYVAPDNRGNYTYTIKQLICGSDFTFMMTSNGTFVFGDNTYGQLGLNRTIYGTQIRTPVLHPFISSLKILKLVAAKGGGKHTIILTSTGEVYAMGRNHKGQLGLGDYVDREVPTRVDVGDVALDVSVGVDHSIVTTGAKSCPNNCNENRGTCDYITGTCNCFVDFTGFDCGLFVCPDVTCSFRGTCDFTIGECICREGFSGERCQNRRCPDSCSGNGKCEYTSGRCECDPGFTGTNCASVEGAASSIYSTATIINFFMAATIALLSLVLF